MAHGKTTVENEQGTGNREQRGPWPGGILRNEANKFFVYIKSFPQKPKKAKKIGNFSAEYPKKDRGKPFLPNEKRERE